MMKRRGWVAACSIAALAACASPAGSSSAALTGEPVGVWAWPEIEFRFAEGVPLERVDVRSVRVLQRGVPIAGIVRVDRATRVARFVATEAMDSGHAYTWELDRRIAPFLLDSPDQVQAPCVMGDEDGDGIPDCREQEGWWYHGQPLYALGARPDQRDVFVEIDYMAATDAEGAWRPWATPQWGALERIRLAFEAADPDAMDHGLPPIRVHFDAGDLFTDAYPDPEGFNLGGGEVVNPPIGNAHAVWVDNPCGVLPATNFLDHYRRPHFTPGREHSFYYVVFSDFGENGSRAKANIHGTNVLIPFGHLTWENVFREPLPLDVDMCTYLAAGCDRPVLDTSCVDPFCNQIVNYQAGTLMHELGHNLGLRHHTGADTMGMSEADATALRSLTDVPIYMSVMTYQYQNFGLPEDPAAYDGDRYHFRFGAACPNQDPGKAGLHRGPLSSWRLEDDLHFILDYSHGELGCIDEAEVDEALGIDGTPEGPAIDWSCNATTSGVIDVSRSNGSADRLCDHDDWAGLLLYYRTWYGQELPPDGYTLHCP